MRVLSAVEEDAKASRSVALKFVALLFGPVGNVLGVVFVLMMMSRMLLLVENMMIFWNCGMHAQCQVNSAHRLTLMSMIPGMLVVVAMAV